MTRTQRFHLLPAFLLFPFSFSIAQTVNTTSKQMGADLPYTSLLLNSSYTSSSGQADFKGAANAFRKNEFENAIHLFDKIIDNSPYDLITIFNRGLSFYKIEDTDHACLDWKYAGFLGSKSSLLNFYSVCDTLVDRVAFTQQGIVVPKNIHTMRIKDELVDAEPEFPDGIDSLNHFLVQQLKIEKQQRLQVLGTRLLVKFKLDEDGRISNISVLDDDSDFKKEAIRITRLMPKWKPAFKDGKPFTCEYIFPVINGKALLKEANIAYNHGVDLLGELRLVEALASFNHAIQINENDFDAIYNRGICHLKMQDTVDACLDWSLASVFGGDSIAGNLINRYCDSLLIYDGDTVKTVSSAKDPKVEKGPFVVVEEMPRFTGGEEEMMKYISHNIKYPPYAREKGITGRVYVRFIVDDKGKIRFARIIRGIGGGCDEEALKVIKSMPDWEPGKQNGRAVRVYFNLPINFSLR